MRRLTMVAMGLLAALPAAGQEVLGEVRLGVSGWTGAGSEDLLRRMMEWPEVLSAGTRDGRIRIVRRPGRELSLARIEELLRVEEAGRIDRDSIELEGDLVLVFEGVATAADLAFLVERVGSVEGVTARALEQPGRIRVAAAVRPGRPLRLGDLLERARARVGGGSSIRFALADLVWTEPRRLGEGP